MNKKTKSKIIKVLSSFSLILVILLIYKNYRNQRIKPLSTDKDKSIIIVGKAPNVEFLLNNKDKYKDIDKMALNSAVHYDLDFKYYIQSDFTTPKKKKIENGVYHKDTSITTTEENILYAKNNGINIILGQYHRYDNGKLCEDQPVYAKLPYEMLKKHNISFETIHISDKDDRMEISTYNNEKLFHQSSSGTILFTAVMYCISVGYNNIYLSGVTKKGGAGGEKSILKFFKNINNYYPNINIICLGMENDSSEIFKCNQNI
jgi:hypothetical protein